MIPDDTKDFAEHEASIGIDVTYHPVPIATHGTIAYLAIPGLARWLDEVGI